MLFKSSPPWEYLWFKTSINWKQSNLFRCKYLSFISDMFRSSITEKSVKKIDNILTKIFYAVNILAQSLYLLNVEYKFYEVSTHFKS